MNYPAPREIPAGKVLLNDRPERAEFAIRETIATAYSRHVAIRAEVRLEWQSPGYECAGSTMRWTNGYWAVRWEDRNGCIQGQRYSLDDEGERKARAHFDRLATAGEG